MRILFLYDTFGGQSWVARLIAASATGLVACGHEVVVLTATDKEILTVPGIRIINLKARPLRWAHYRAVFSVRRAREVLAVIDEYKPDIIHGHLLNWQLGFRWIHGARARGIPVFFTCHSVIPMAYGKVKGDERSWFWRDIQRMRWQWNPLRNVLIRKALAKANLIYVSSALQSLFVRHGFAPGNIVYNGIDTQFWIPQDKQKARQERRLPADAPIFLFAGRLGADKGMHLLWNIWKRIPGAPHLVIAGLVPSSIPTELRDVVHTFADQTYEQMRSLYAAADATVVPSQYLDPFPTVCIESQACGRPVLATSMGGAPEAIANGETGWVLNPQDEQAWIDQISWCAAHRDELEHMQQAGRKRAEERYSRERHINELLKLYKNTQQL